MPERRAARLIALFIAAAVLINFPVLGVIEAVRVAGMSILPFYLFACWAAIIVVAALLVEPRRRG